MSPKNKILLFKFSSRYEVGAHFIEELSAGFRALNCSVTTLDPLANGFADRFVRLVDNPPTFCLSLNAVTADFDIDGKAYHEILGCPLIGLYIDDPLVPHLSQRLCRQNHLATQTSPALTGLVNTRFSLPTATLYHGGSSHTLPPSSERSIDFLLTGTYSSPDSLRRAWEEELPKTWQRQIEELIEIAKEEDEQPIWKIWEGAEGLGALVGEHVVVPRAELYVRHWRRDRLLQTLEDVTLVGEGWENCPYTKGHKLLGPATYEESMELMGKSKVVLHITPSFCAGSHERPLTAMLQGCAALVDGSPFFQNAFRAGKELEAYSWKDLERLPAAAEKALKNWEELGKAGQKAVQSAHTWKHRAAELLELINVDCNI